jgi:hypothetical protein
MLRVCCRDGWGDGDDCVDLGDCAGCVGCGVCGLFCVVRVGVVDVVGGDVFVGGELGVVFVGGELGVVTCTTEAYDLLGLVET